MNSRSADRRIGRRYVFVVEQKYKRTWYPWVPHVELYEAQNSLRDARLANPEAPRDFRIRKYVTVKP